MRRLLLGLLLIAMLFGSPYAALVLNRVMGPWTATGTEHDGSAIWMRFDPDMAPADFVPMYPGAAVAQSSRLVSREAPSGVGFLELAVHASAAEVRDFYRSRLEATGFTVDDYGTLGLNPAAAAYLSIDGALVATRPATDDVVMIQIRAEEGIFVRSRTLQLQWRKLSEWPAGQPKP